MLTAQQQADKWASKAGSAGNDYKNGIQGTNVNPMQLAVAQQGVMTSKWNESINSGRWAARMNATSQDFWKRQAMGKGAANYGNGIAAGKEKYIAAANYYNPIYAQIKDAVRQFPRDGAGGSLQRVQLAMQMLQQAKQSRGR